jgi:hypothetical protein
VKCRSRYCSESYSEENISTAEFINTVPYTISQISFEKKTRIEKHMLMLGDAAGMITPLCGNGMSMADAQRGTGI